MIVKEIMLFVVAVGICLGVGFLGSSFTMPAIEGWYSTIEKPSFNPPNWIFAPVWTVLFVLMGISLYLVIRKGFSSQVGLAVLLFVVQLILNVLWSFFFFARRSPGLALVDIVILWVAILALILVFVRIERWAGYLLIPYLLWVSFATVLNASIFVLNRT
ncbi:TspO and MBR like protein [Spirochaeta thermophila DSM 6578]|uniref:TspO and MBR like protein n=1 Tax=Winmispira thermophila (strain ATCC 700085 / DSM 6578 / Z-1203) TaxID=869211 RepID=G0GB59_WINT7|nr:TspO/MBR family protein [Spirochaeta thermophila]AEJ61083.1 TspO and MBR like protein [Spirochaeta thermophila DSM 6578]